MRVENVFVITGREYRARIQTLGFWIATASLPLLLVAVLVLPVFLLTQTTSARRVVVVDTTGRVGEALVAGLTGDPELPPAAERLDEAVPGAGGAASEGQLGSFVPALELPAADLEQQRADLDRRVLAGEIDAWVWIDDAGLAADRIEYHAESVSSFVTQERLERAASAAIRAHRLAEAGLDHEQIDRLGRSVALTTMRVTEAGSREEQAATGVVLAWVLFFLLYIAIMVYGQQVMLGVIEEKSSRIVEIIVATTRPVELMLGKLLGICCVALTQLGIWLGTLFALTLPPVVARIGWLSAYPDVPTLAPALILHFFAFFTLGFVLYASFYGAVGAAFDNVQEAQQFAIVGSIVGVVPVLLFGMVLNDPDSTASVASSLVPLFTPLLMLLRLAVKAPPWWQVALGYLLTVLLTWVMVWISGRVYRVGILMYGKNPSLPEIWRWIRYA